MIHVENITKEYRPDDNQSSAFRALRGISFEIKQGEIVAIVGPSGAGKSTLLHILGTLDRPSSGRVFYEGEDVFGYTDERLAKFRNRNVGFVFQFHHLLPEFSVLENVAMPALIQGKKLEEVENRAIDLLAQVNVASKASSRPSKLSGGEQQRVAVARALMNSPKVVLADEPSGNLDTVNSHQLHELIWNLSRTMKQTFVIVTHNEGLARQSDHVVTLKDGEIAGNFF